NNVHSLLQKGQYRNPPFTNVLNGFQRFSLLVPHVTHTELVPCPRLSMPQPLHHHLHLAVIDPHFHHCRRENSQLRSPSKHCLCS
uniref:Uncharacterized protein n=1 Tax=Ciona intestinalis TaxID=7719 RepID=H2Y2M4_CIOIN